MRAVVWHGSNHVSVDTVPDPGIVDPTDVVVKVTRTAICGSDLHLYDGYVPTMEDGDILGHEFMGEVVDAGKDVKMLQKGDRVVVPFTISCGRCFYCTNGLWALCSNTNPNYRMMEKVYGAAGGGIYGYSHMYGGFAGGQAEYVRVPYADFGPIKIPGEMPDEKVLFLSDILPTGWQAAEYAGIKPGDIVAVWGCGPVGQMTIQSAYLMGADRVIALDRVSERLEMAEQKGKAEVINYEETDDIVALLKDITDGQGPDCCIDAVGMEAHGTGFLATYDKVMQQVRLQTDRPTVLRQVIQACRKGGTVSVPGVYGGFIDKFPMGAAFAKGLTIRMGQTHVQRHLPRLLDMVASGQFDPSFVITHRLNLKDAPHGYEIFKHKEDRCIKIVMEP